MTTFRTLEKAILSKEQLAAFQSSKTYVKVTSYIEALNNAVVGRKLTDECTQSEVRRVCFGPFVFLPFHQAGFCSPLRGFVVLLGSRSIGRGAGSRRGAGEGDAPCRQRGFEVWESCVYDIL